MHTPPLAPADSWRPLRVVLAKTESLERLLRWFNNIGIACFSFLVVLTFADVFLRYVFDRPLDGTVELSGILMAMIVLLSTAYAQWTKTHICMDIITLRLSPQKRLALESATLFWSVCILGFATWTMAHYGFTNNKVTPILRIPYAPFIHLGAFGCAMLALTVARDALQAFIGLIDAGGTRRDQWMAALGSVAAPLLAWLIVSHGLSGVSSITLGFVGIVILFVLFFLGMPVAFALMATGFVFVCLLRGEPAAFGMFGKAWFGTVSNYTWAPLMSFMLMGYVCYHGRFGEDLYRTARNWMGHMRGGLAMGSVVACALFGAVVGDVLSGSIAMAAIALPEMRRTGYDDELAVGTLACSGTIGALIPPSTFFILYGVLAEQSISDLFMAGIIPGILCTVCFLAAIWVMVWRRPQLAPRLPRVGLQERLASLKSGLPIITLFVLVIGGIYGGLFTATEGGAIGACGTFILALIMRRLSWRVFMDAMVESCRYTAMCFTLLGGASVLGYFMTMSRIPTWLASSIAAMNIPPMLVLLTIVLLVCFLGCFLPAIPLLLICIPIFVPIAKVFQWDLIWFGVIFVILNNMASITPPFGISLFVMKGVAKIPLLTMFRASVPFIIALTVCLLLTIFFPELSTWLPYYLK